jgi:pyruvate kinase
LSPGGDPHEVSDSVADLTERPGSGVGGVLRRTRIVATLGPASDDEATLRAMFDAGMDVARVSLAHGPLESAIERIRRVRALAPHIAVLADLPGPKIRSTPFPSGGVELQVGDAVALAPGSEVRTSNASRIGVALDEAVRGLAEGDRVAIGDGGVSLVVTGRKDGEVICQVTGGGHVQGQPGVALPSHRLSLATPTQEDLDHIGVLVKEGVDHIAVSFVRGPDDMRRAREALQGSPVMLVAKIETEEAIEHLDEVLRASDAVMVARGDLGMRLPLEDIPHLQKRIIRTGVRMGLPVITATQMLESMVESTVPTRAEVTDVANAVLDGTSDVMLSGETAIGRDPAHVVETMARIVKRTEEDFNYFSWGRNLAPQEIAGEPGSAAHITAAITAAAWRAALELDASAIVACTRSGASARAISRFRPRMRVVAATTTERVLRQLSLSWGVETILVGERVTTDDVIKQAVDAAAAAGLVNPGEVLVVLAGSPHAEVSVCDTLQIVKVPG